MANASKFYSILEERDALAACKRSSWNVLCYDRSEKSKASDVDRYWLHRLLEKKVPFQTYSFCISVISFLDKITSPPILSLLSSLLKPELCHVLSVISFSRTLAPKDPAWEPAMS